MCNIFRECQYMIRQFLKEKTAVTALALLFKTAISHAQQAPIQFIDQLPSTEQEKIVEATKSLLDNPSAQGTELFHLLSGEIDTNTTTLDSFQIKDLTTPTSLYCDQIPTMTLNSNTPEDRLKSFLNLLGFGGKFFDKPVTIVSALTQYLPEIHIRAINGIKNIFFTDPAFTDTNFAENISYYDSLSGLSHLVPTSVSSQRLHDLLLAYAFSGKKNPDLKVTGLCERGANGVRLPVIEIIGNFLALKLSEHVNEGEQLIFSGSGFSGAVAQEVAYHLKLKRANLKLNVLTTQAMRYLTDDFIKDYDHVLGWKNVFSINTNRDWSISINLTYQKVSFGCLGQQIRLNLTPPKNTWLSTLAQNSGFWQSQATENQKGVIFKNQKNPRAQLLRILRKIQQNNYIEYRDFVRILEFMDGIAQTQSSSNALATATENGYFLKTSRGPSEHQNLEKIRDFLKIKNNLPTLLNLAEQASMVIPASYYDSTRDITITLAHAVGNAGSAHERLANILNENDFTQTAELIGTKLGSVIAALHTTTGCLRHGDFHLNNIRFDSDGNTYIIDIETLANGIIDGNLRDSNGFKDILDLIAKTTSHMYKSGTYGASKGWGLLTTLKEPTETERKFASSVLKGYISSLDQKILLQIKQQYHDFQNRYGGDVNKFLNNSYISTYNNTVFTQVFNNPAIDALLK